MLSLHTSHHLEELAYIRSALTKFPYIRHMFSQSLYTGNDGWGVPCEMSMAIIANPLTTWVISHQLTTHLGHHNAIFGLITSCSRTHQHMMYSPPQSPPSALMPTYWSTNWQLLEPSTWLVDACDFSWSPYSMLRTPETIGDDDDDDDVVYSRQIRSTASCCWALVTM